MSKCAIHDEMAKRLDERWCDHIKDQEKVNDTLFSKVDEVSKQTQAIDKKLNWILGGFAAVQLFFHFIWTVLQKGVHP